MLGPGTKRIYVPERYRDCVSFERVFKRKFGGMYKFQHVAPSGSVIYFVTEPPLSQFLLEEFEDELWDKEKSNKVNER